MERLKAFSVEKFTLDGRKFHTLTILSTKYLLRVLLTQLDLYSLYAWPLVAVTELNSKNLKKNLSLLGLYTKDDLITVYQIQMQTS